ncbi:MAG: TPM domain-containing protein, partial [Candidatus Omnitrophota bacterium]
MRKFFLIVCFFCLCFCCAAQDIPEPSGWVNDFAGVLSQADKNEIIASIETLKAKTSAEVFVVTLQSIAPYEEKEYARLIFDKWKPGKRGLDNGVLILLAIKERRWRIETGYGIEGVLPDGLCGQIGRAYMVPYFKAGDYSSGLREGVKEVANIILNPEAKNDPNLKPSKKSTGGPPALIVLIFFYIWNIPWPFFIGLPFTLIFAFALAQSSPLLGVCPLIGYCGAMVTRIFIWKGQPVPRKSSLWKMLIFGLAVMGSSYGRNRSG